MEGQEFKEFFLFFFMAIFVLLKTLFKKKIHFIIAGVIFIIMSFCIFTLFFSEKEDIIFHAIRKEIKEHHEYYPIIDMIMREKQFYPKTKDDNITGNFFVEIGSLVKFLIEKNYDINVYQIVIGENPSNPIKLNGDPKNDIILKNSIASEENRNTKYANMVARKYHTDFFLKKTENSRMFVIYREQNLLYNTFLENVQNSNGKIIPIQIDRKLETFEKGQIWIIQNNITKKFVIFREKGGIQAHLLRKEYKDDISNNKQGRQIIFDGFFNSKNQLRLYADGEITNILNNFFIYKLIFKEEE